MSCLNEPLTTEMEYIKCSSCIELYWSLVSPFHDSLYFDFLKALKILTLEDADGFGVCFEMTKKCYSALYGPPLCL